MKENSNACLFGENVLIVNLIISFNQISKYTLIGKEDICHSLTHHQSYCNCNPPVSKSYQQKTQFSSDSEYSKKH